MPPTPVPAGSPEGKVIGELLVAAGNAGLQYASQVEQYVEGFNPQIENGIVVVENDAIAKMPALVQPIAKTVVGLLNGYIDANAVTLEGEGWTALCNLAVTEGTKLQA